MNENLSNLILGISGGIVSTVIIWFFIQVYRKIIYPAIKSMLYKGIDLEGEWHCDVFLIGKNNATGNIKPTKKKRVLPRI